MPLKPPGAYYPAMMAANSAPMSNPQAVAFYKAIEDMARLMILDITVTVPAVGIVAPSGGGACTGAAVGIPT